MKKEKRDRLEAKGWAVGSATEFLGLSKEEEEFIELKIRLSACLKEQRQKGALTQESLAKRINSSQSRVAKMEACGSDVTVDLLLRALFAAGMSRRELAKAIAA